MDGTSLRYPFFMSLLYCHYHPWVNLTCHWSFQVLNQNLYQNDWGGWQWQIQMSATAINTTDSIPSVRIIQILVEYADISRVTVIEGELRRNDSQ
ncbi:hypothetical protein HRI_005235200 [Hibiscus trionum]|uniref:Uncharacterized protein n=1 Tax=Hibiscus trionum TaxID=183268 RepID=A0A9W7JKL1_HIBTR|nr:hypothetical protein HRI_005235200 [Hibiscus trionum]